LAYSQLLQACANSTSCALHESSASKVEARINAILASLDVQPIPVDLGENYGVVDWSMARTVLWNSVTSPYGTIGQASTFAMTMAAFADAEKGNGTSLFLLSENTDGSFTCECDSQPDPVFTFRTEAAAAISCSDGDSFKDDLNQFRQFFQELSGESKFADVWATANAQCR
jgi:hypothetical protein